MTWFNEHWLHNDRDVIFWMLVFDLLRFDNWKICENDMITNREMMIWGWYKWVVMYDKWFVRNDWWYMWNGHQMRHKLLWTTHRQLLWVGVPPTTVHRWYRWTINKSWQRRLSIRYEYFVNDLEIYEYLMKNNLIW